MSDKQESDAESNIMNYVSSLVDITLICFNWPTHNRVLSSQVTTLIMYTVLYCPVLYCTILNYTVLYCNVHSATIGRLAVFNLSECNVM